jgi:drug/metabolite transporter (DMT)-like permease
MSRTSVEGPRTAQVPTPWAPDPTRATPMVLIAFAAVYIVWGSTYFAIRVGIESFPPFILAGLRHLCAGLVLYPVFRTKTGIRPTARHWRSAVVTGFLLLCVGNGAVSWAEQTVPSGVAALLVATVSLWLVILDWLRPGGVQPVFRVVVGLVLGFAGLVLLMGPVRLGGAEHVDSGGAGILVIASLAWACGSLYSKHGGGPGSPMLSVAMQCLAGGAILLLVGLFTGEFHALNLAAVSVRSWLALGYLIVFGSGIGFSAYIYILQQSTATRVGTYAFVNPMVALFLGWLLAGETVSLRTAIAAGVIVTAVILVITAPHPASVRIAKKALPAAGEA